MATYAYIDVSQKQEFIYKHNKLRDNLTNSFIIKSVTEKIEGMDLSKVGVSLSGYLNEKYPAQSEFVYSGGGNSIVCFDTWDQGKSFVQGYSTEVLKAYPDLELYISLVDDTEVGGHGAEQEKKIRELLFEKADQLKDKRRSRFRRWTYGVEKIDETGQAVMSNHKGQNNKLPKQYLQQRFTQRLSDTQIKITDELQDYKKGEEGKSYIGILVIDGNKMGEMARQISTFQQLNLFSKVVEDVYETAMVNALKSYEKLLCKDQEEAKLPSFYITPVLLAGDDLCLITEAEHAIEIAASILENIKDVSKQKGQLIPFLNEVSVDYLTACSGVAIIKYTYPFFEGVKAAENLCYRAKEMLYKVQDKDTPLNASFIDWEILQGQVSTDKAYEDYVIHRRDQEVFHIKPLCIDQEQAVTAAGVYSYKSFINLVQKIRQDKDISNSLLEDLKKNLYSGWEQYQLFFDMRQGSRKLDEIVGNIFRDNSINCAARVGKEGTVTSYTYILNDVLDVLPFINYQEVQNNVAEAGS